ncbi:ferritin-like domain-containing protein [Kitasatospora sp. NPDC048545]|uniref:ferritin-like domain-containing protein n=1 Tax=Kitasatospora sp. NPDC048545 TaxID=3157208 RepID=UPI0034002813
MSYLGFPRLNFAGTFQADVATANNLPPYFDNDVFEPRFQWRMNLPDPNGLWNPRGSGAMRLTDIAVTSVCQADGRVLTDPAADPVINGRLADDDRRAHGKFADLDPQNQMVAEIHGLRMRLLDAQGAELLRADLETTAMEDVWIRATLPSGRGDPSATYQSVLGNLQWADRLGSPFLRTLRQTTQGGLLSIKFTLDAVEDGVESWPANLTYGRMVGAVGPYVTGEPHHLVAGRRLRTTSADSAYQHAPCRVDEASGTVFVDLGNSIRAGSRGGPLVPVGPLRLAALRADGSPEDLAPLEGLETGFYERAAGIVTAKLTPAQRTAVRERRLAVVDPSGGQPAVVLAENADGTFLRADGGVFRLYPEAPHDTARTVLYATRYGRPAAGVTIALDGAPPVLEVPRTVTTGADGRAVVTLTGRDPGNPRGAVDGIAPQVGYAFADRPKEPEGQLSVRLFSHSPVPARPTWVRDVHPVLQQYANLYPAMKDVFDLADPNQVIAGAEYVKRSLLAPLDSPNHMPVTRDLSPGKRDTIVKWLDTEPSPPILEIVSADDLRAALQQALNVELATIPPYLAALLSVKAGTNVEIAEIIRSVVREEMQHLAQVANLLNAVGGQPRIGRPGLVPTYPGRLPGPVLPDLTVRLRRLSVEHVRDVFMAIEQPEHPLVDGKPFTGSVIAHDAVKTDGRGKVQSADGPAMDRLESWFGKAEYRPQTIGWFYNQIARGIIRLSQGGKLFAGDPARQVSWPGAPSVLYQVTDKRSALLAVHQIIEQGEGSPHDLNGNGIADIGELGHYYRFKEIVEGRRLARGADGTWSYTGPPVPFDPQGVLPMADDPDTYKLPAGSAARRDSLQCDTSYTNALTSLNRVFNGHPGEMDDAVGLMYQMQVQAKKLLDTASPGGGGTVLGPAFQSPGVPF